nr:(Fe-S)-binding protein [uncultured Holophaga sp.]
MSWSELEDAAVRCSRCGACQQLCPIFRELGTEASATRGKIALIRAAIRGQVGPTDGLGERLSLCLACKACSAGCPSGVPGDRLVLEARQAFVGQRGLPLIKRLALRYFLRNRGLFRLGMKLGPLGQRLVLKHTPNGALPRLPMGLDRRRLLPQVAPHSFREQHPELVEAPEPRGRVALFTGCMVNHIYPEIGEAALEVLLQQGFSVLIPKDQHCCGLPAHANGDGDTARELARAVLENFAEQPVDAVITLCGSCGGTLQKEYAQWFASEPTLARTAGALASKVQDFSAFLDSRGLRGRLAERPLTVTYHDSCHLARGMGVTAAPRKLLRAIPGLEFREMDEAARCCGAAGSFSLAHYDLTLKINARKTGNILATGASTVVTGCPGCVMQLRDGLHQQGAQVDTRHIAQILRDALPGRGVTQ